MAAAIELKKLSKRFGGTLALDRVSLSVEAGQIYGFLGPNGAGKTTTIRCLMDFIHPTGGKVILFGRDSHRDGVDLKRRIGFLPADNEFYPNWSARQHIAFYQKVRGQKAKSADKLIKQLELDPKTAAKHLSTGNKQKLALVLAMMHEPELLVMDEPTRGLDPLIQEQIYALLHEFRSKGGTVFVSSHNLAEVEKICDQVGIIRAGKLVASESMEVIRGMKAHVVTAVFAKEVNPNDFKLPGIEVVGSHANTVTMMVRGDVNPLISRLAMYALSDLEIGHPNLEDVFLEYYRQEGKGK